MKRVAFDVMGNDNGVASGVNAVNEFVSTNNDFYFLLVGDQDLISKHLVPSPNIEVIDVKKVASHKQGLRVARETDSSMFKAINLVETTKADIVISSGDSATYLAMATLNLKRLAKIKRPAFMPVFPTIMKNKKFVMVDVGANLEVTPTMLAQWAQIGTIFSQKILNTPNPKVAIVNVGREKHKGKNFHLETYKKLASDKKIRFCGFIEPRNLLNGEIDVVLSDGYAGNMILKTMEGTVLSLLKMLKKTLMSKFQYKIGALLSRGAFQEIRNQLDYRNVGSAWVIGLKHLVVKCHGSADKDSYLGAFKQIKMALNRGLEKALQEGNYE